VDCCGERRGGAKESTNSYIAKFTQYLPNTRKNGRVMGIYPYLTAHQNSVRRSTQYPITQQKTEWVHSPVHKPSDSDSEKNIDYHYYAIIVLVRKSMVLCLALSETTKLISYFSDHYHPLFTIITYGLILSFLIRVCLIGRNGDHLDLCLICVNLFVNLYLTVSDNLHTVPSSHQLKEQLFSQYHTSNN
jgi:hypothetical protein